MRKYYIKRILKYGKEPRWMYLATTIGLLIKNGKPDDLPGLVWQEKSEMMNSRVVVKSKGAVNYIINVFKNRELRKHVYGYEVVK